MAVSWSRTRERLAAGRGCSRRRCSWDCGRRRPARSPCSPRWLTCWESSSFLSTSPAVKKKQEQNKNAEFYEYCFVILHNTVMYAIHNIYNQAEFKRLMVLKIRWMSKRKYRFMFSTALARNNTNVYVPAI